MKDIIKYHCANQTAIVGLKIARVTLHAGITGTKVLFGKIRQSMAALVKLLI